MNARQRRVARRADDRRAAAIEAGYAEYLANVKCDCCPACNIRPCGGSAAGGFCDDLCHCGSDYC